MTAKHDCTSELASLSDIDKNMEGSSGLLSAPASVPSAKNVSDDPLAAPTGTRRTLSGMEAAAYGAYALTEVATIFPITPASHMSEQLEAWSVAGIKNAFGVPLILKEMQSEKGAAGAMHGALCAGALTSTCTASQGLLLMIPNMYKMAGEMLPGVMHVTGRSLASHALSIFGDHQDVMAARACGCAMLASANVQECMDFSIIAHLSAIEGSLPFVHFFDGFRTSDEISTIQTVSRDDIAGLVDCKALARFRARSMDPLHPTVRGAAQDSDIYFQNREASNPAYDALPVIVEHNMARLAAITGREYNLFDYVGAPDAQAVVVTMCSSVDVVEGVVRHLCKDGYKVGLVKVRLFRPFAAEKLMSAIPASAKVVCALDRTKEPGSLGEPLFQDVALAVMNSGRADMRVIGGRYGLSSKDFTPSMAADVIANVLSDDPKPRFTVGIDDNLTYLSLAATHKIDTLPAGTRQAVFYGFGSDGTVGASKQLAHMLGDAGTLWAQGYSWFDSKKSGGLTISYLRLAGMPISAPYLIEDADYVACHKDIYVKRGYPMADRLRDGGVFVLNTAWTADELAQNLPHEFKASLARKHAKFYCIDAAAIAVKVGLGARINMIMEVAYLYLAHPIPFEQALAMLKDAVRTMYANKGDDVVAKNLSAIQEAQTALEHANFVEGDRSLCGDFCVSAGTPSEAAQPSYAPTDTQKSLESLSDLPQNCESPVSAEGLGEVVGNSQLGSVSETKGVEGGSEHILTSAGSACACIRRDGTERLRDSSRSDESRTAERTPDAPSASLTELQVEESGGWFSPSLVQQTMETLRGDELPTSAFSPDGFIPLGGSAWEKRTVALAVPEWDPSACVQCFRCSFVCPHAAIRPYLATDAELKDVPDSFVTTPTSSPRLAGFHLRIQNYPQDCVGCGSCAYTCPAPGGALHMKPLASQIEEQCENLKFAQDNISVKDGILPPTDVISTQLQQPLLQFSGACAGCGETPNVKLLTQLFGDRLIIANATGCSSIWGGYAPASPYCKNQHGRGPAWGNSLFEDNAEYGYGIMKGILARRTRLINMAKVAVSRKDTPTDVAVLLDAWIAVKGDPDQSLAAGEDAAAAIKKYLQLGDFSAAKAADVGDNSYGIALGVDGDEASKTAPAAANEGDTFYTFPINNLLREIYDARDMFQKKSVWAIGGDGWAFDIDYDGLDAVLASGEDINMLVLDTEGYSNTGGEMSKATQLGSVSTFSLAGKDTPKKRLARMCIQYDYVYVAQVCFGADMNQIITALREAEAYPGPSIVIALCPCISWGLKSGMGAAVGACRDAVRTGYWTLWRYNPTLAAAGQNPLTIDSKPPQGEAALRKFLMGQNRFASLAAKNPERSSMLQSELAKERATNREELDAMQDVYALKNKAKS